MRETKSLNGWNGERSKTRTSKFWALMERAIIQLPASSYPSRVQNFDVLVFNHFNRSNFWSLALKVVCNNGLSTFNRSQLLFSRFKPFWFLVVQTFGPHPIIAHLHRRKYSNLPLIFIANIFIWIPISFSISIRSFIVFHAFRICSVIFVFAHFCSTLSTQETTHLHFSTRNESLWLTTITFERAVERQRCKMLHFPIARRRYCHYTCFPSDSFSLALLSPTTCSMLAQWRDCSI